MHKWYRTGEYEIGRQVKAGVYEFIKFYFADGMYHLAKQDKIITANWKDSDGNWDADAVSIINCHCKSLDELKKKVAPEDQEFYVAQWLYDQTCSLADVEPMTETEAKEYLITLLIQEN